MQLVLTECEPVLSFLFEKHADAVATTRCGSTYAKLGLALLARIRALPLGLQGKRALADALAAADAEHDANGRAAMLMLQAYVASPRAAADVKAAAGRLLDALYPSGGVFKETYANEGAAARAAHARADVLVPDLALFPVAGGATLEAWVGASLEAGARLLDLLEQRGLVADAQARRDAMALRTEAVGLVGRFREALRDELAARPELPRDLETNLFALHDQILCERRPATSATPEAAAGTASA